MAKLSNAKFVKEKVKVLIPMWLIRHVLGVRPTEVLHVGAHLAEERDAYVKHGFGPLNWIEASPEAIAVLKQILAKTPDRIWEGAAWDEDGAALKLNHMSNSQASSVLKPDELLRTYSEITQVGSTTVKSLRIDSLSLNFTAPLSVFMDIQGAEAKALAGMSGIIARVGMIYVEVDYGHLYVGAPAPEQLSEMLRPLGFYPALTRMTSKGWGDRIYFNSAFYPLDMNMRLRILVCRTLFFASKFMARAKATKE